jgi:hypothetical protein
MIRHTTAKRRKAKADIYQSWDADCSNPIPARETDKEESQTQIQY